MEIEIGFELLVTGSFGFNNFSTRIPYLYTFPSLDASTAVELRRQLTARVCCPFCCSSCKGMLKMCFDFLFETESLPSPYHPILATVNGILRGSDEKEEAMQSQIWEPRSRQ
ncbi:hypothetical protein RchiOBHm_Chr2g0102691 [Rosa chinensis]|uniref:Uncharacterized protein n=1 Tax=Rosa chinensis TaxID=74649 RepID=A0A2P6RMQ3_ROSCH|nr:hypothetical protein RchiOBHm_Chr2g0102691 [Rosa chinensis]